MLPAILISILTILVINLGLVVMMASFRVRLAHQDQTRQSVSERWAPRIQALLAGETSAATLLPLVRRADRPHLVDVLTEYGTRVNGVELDWLRDLGTPLLDPVSKELSARQPERRARAVQTLGVLAGASRSSDLTRMLGDDSPLVAMTAASWLSLLGDSQPAGEVVAHLERFDLWSTNFLASMLAGGGTTMVGHLREALEDEECPNRSRAVAADALRLMKDPGAAEIAARVLDDTADREIAAACLRVLQQLGTTDNAPIVREYAGADDFVLRALAMTALGSIGGTDQDAAILDRALDDSSAWVAIHAAKALHTTGRLDILRRAAMSSGPGAGAAGEVLLGGEA